MKPNHLLGIAELIVALGALPAGWLFITHPDGSAMKIPVDLLHGSPFRDYLIPGLFLFIVNGLCQLGAAFLSFKGHSLAAWAGLALGGILVMWIIIQVSIIGLNSFLQYTFFIVGGLVVILAWRIIRLKNNPANP